MRKIHRRRGAAMIEFALWVPILVMLVAGIVDLARYMSVQHVVVRAARDGARLGVTVTQKVISVSPRVTEAPDAATIQQTAVEHGLGILTESGITTGTTVNARWYRPALAPANQYCWLEVTATAPYVQMMGALPGLGNTVRHRFTMMTQAQPTASAPVTCPAG